MIPTINFITLNFKPNISVMYYFFFFFNIVRLYKLNILKTKVLSLFTIPNVSTITSGSYMDDNLMSLPSPRHSRRTGRKKSQEAFVIVCVNTFPPPCRCTSITEHGKTNK